MGNGELAKLLKIGHPASLQSQSRTLSPNQNENMQAVSETERDLKIQSMEMGKKKWPPILYRYFGSHGLITLKEAKLRASKLSSWNDPFEGMFSLPKMETIEDAKLHIRNAGSNPAFVNKIQVAKGLQTFQETVEFIKNNEEEMAEFYFSKMSEMAVDTEKTRAEFIDRTLRAISFSSCKKQDDENLLWSHYSTKHKGIRIGFKFMDSSFELENIIKINYLKTRPEYAHLVDPTEDEIKSWMSTKHPCWEYEGEYRYFIQSQNCEHHYMPTDSMDEYVGFNKEWVRSVDFGVKFPRSNRDSFMQFMKEEYPHAVCSQARYHQTDYTLEYDKLSI